MLSTELTTDASDPGACLLRAFEKTDEQFISGSEVRIGTLSFFTDLATRKQCYYSASPYTFAQGAQDGCTATACLLRGGDMWVANAGDSRTVLVKQESVVQVTTDHKPNEPNEKARILAAGGSIIFYGVWRVNGTL